MKKALIILLVISAVMGGNFVWADSEIEIRQDNIRFDEDDPNMENAESKTNKEDDKNYLKEEIINKHANLSKQVSGNGRTIGIILFLTLLGMVGIKYLKRE